MGALLAAALLGVGSWDDPDYGKMLGEAKLSLADAVARGVKEIPGGAALSAYLEDAGDGARFYVFVCKGKETTELVVDPKEGKVLGKKLVPEADAKEDAKIAEAIKITLAKAIEVATKKVPGKAVYVDFDLDAKGPPEAEVDVFAGGKVTRVFVNAQTGEILKTEEKR